MLGIFIACFWVVFGVSGVRVFYTHVRKDTFLGGVIRVRDWLRLFLGGSWRVGSARFVHKETFHFVNIVGVSVDCFWVAFRARCAEGYIFLGGGWRVGSARFVHREPFRVVFYFCGQRQLF